MKYKYTHLISVIILTAIALKSVPLLLLVLAAWIALALGAVALAYKYNWAMLFRKKKNGVIPASVRWVFTPYLVGVTLYNIYIKSKDSVPVIQKIEPNLYLGARMRAGELENLHSVKIQSVLDLTAEFDGLGDYAQEHDIDYLNIPVLDHGLPKLHQLVQACRWIDKNVKRKRSVLVHCALGRGRSVLVVAAYLLASKKAGNVEEALDNIRTIRATARLNKRQHSALTKWKEELQQSTIKKEQAWLIANPVSGTEQWPRYKQDIIARLENHFDLHVVETSKQQGADYWAKQALKAKAGLVIISGGDGTVGEAASVLANTDTVMGVLPLGTANALSHAIIGWQTKIIPVESACETIESGEPRRIDTALCNKERMLLAMGIGIEAKMITEASAERKSKLGQLAYIDGFFRALKHGNEYKLDVKFDDEPVQRIVTKSLVVANAAPVTTLLAQGNGSPNYSDGFLDVTWLPKGGEVADEVMSLGALALSGLYERPFDGHVFHKRAKKISISSPGAIHYVLDGEPKCDQQITLELESKSLRIFVPVTEDNEGNEGNEANSETEYGENKAQAIEPLIPLNKQEQTDSVLER
ncbi:dual specificity protein phosphatase family protein [Saccharophagus degradans]|uniref:diacylglycerol kinase family protein n=1 Tax=Saccharophagus degradans TaxID=86304 RepID=UPI001C084FD1|nr:diacylglycerol kinase family protein [Saccharophagus degradans]MBU2986928.1 dual specificity protein phosphatase family protein [Saccharophagus degradans]